MSAKNDIDWMSKAEAFKRAEQFLAMLRQLFMMDIQDTFIGLSNKMRKRAIKKFYEESFQDLAKIIPTTEIIKTFENIMPDAQLHPELIPAFMQQEAIQKKIFERLAIDFLNMLVLHELYHGLSGEADELKTDEAVKVLMNGFQKMKMGWKYINCPKNKKKVTWTTCLDCKDKEKHPSCPLRYIRIDAIPREYEFGLYHVTELPHPRSSYFERIGNPYARDWIEYYDMLIGKAFGWYLESKHPMHCHEVDLKWKPENTPDDFRGIVGHQDLHLEADKRLIEIKLYKYLGYMIKAGKASADHVFQVQMYYALGKRCKTWLYKDIKKITIIYYSKSKEKLRRKEFEVPVVDILENGLINALLLHEALKTKNPDKLPRCPLWRCKGYCKHSDCKYHPKHTMFKLGEKK